MSTETTVDLMELVDAYLVRTGREINERNRLNAIYTTASWAKRYPAWKQKQKDKKANETRPRVMPDQQKQALVAEYLTFENKRRKDYNAALTTGVGLPMLELGYGSGQVTFENAVFAAEQWFAEKVQSYDDNVVASAKAFKQFAEAEEQRAVTILSKPMASDDPMYRKYKHLLTPIREDLINDYAKLVLEDEKKGTHDWDNAIAFVVNQAETALVTEFSSPERARIISFLKVNELDPMAENNWTTVFLILQESQIIRRAPVSWSSPTGEPKLPKFVERPAPETQPQGRAAEQIQREKDTLADIRAAFGDALETVQSRDTVNPTEDAVLFQAYSSLMQQKSELSLENIRKAIFYAILQCRGQRPAYSAYSQAEVEGWQSGAELGSVTASEHDYEMRTYGDVRLSRVQERRERLKHDKR